MPARTHGLTHTPEYASWQHAKARCYNTGDKHFSDYGGRGITMCDRWRDSFELFLADMGPRPSRKHSIDRKNNDGHYEPSNCRWADPFQQANNTRHNRVVSALGAQRTMTEWARALAAKPGLVKARIRYGWSDHDAVTRPKRQGRTLTHNGQTMTVAEWSRQCGLPCRIIQKRIRIGWTADKALSTPSGAIKGRASYITFRGETHTTSEWARLRGFKKTTLHRRLGHGWSIERALNTPVA
jgi:hypothetical protein